MDKPASVVPVELARSAELRLSLKLAHRYHGACVETY